MFASSLPVLALILTTLTSNADSVFSENASDANELLAADDSTWLLSSSSSTLKEAGPNATVRSNLTRTVDGAIKHAESFWSKYVSTIAEHMFWTAVLIVVVIILLVSCFCGAVIQRQSRETKNVVDGSGETPRASGELPNMSNPSASQQQQMQLPSPLP